MVTVTVTVCGVRCAVCGVRCAVCGVRCAVCGVRAECYRAKECPARISASHWGRSALFAAAGPFIGCISQ